MSFQQMGLALAVGVAIGVVFALMKLPLPTPDKIEGVLGVIGVFFGMLLVKQFFG